MQNSYMVSIRKKTVDEPVEELLSTYNIPFEQMEGVFGFVDWSPLCGGRRYHHREVSDADIKWLQEHNIEYRVPLTNMYVSDEEYDAARPFLDSLYQPGIGIIVANDDFARKLRRDYPDFNLEGSTIKNIRNKDEVTEALELYDSIVLEPTLNDDTELLESIEEKDRVILFGVAGCGYHCKHKICYPSISKFNKTLSGDIKCSYFMVDRDRQQRWFTFDLDKFNDLGYHRFKMIKPHIKSKAYFDGTNSLED